MRLVDDAAGRIRRILLTFPRYAIEEFGASVRAIITALPGKAEIDVLAAPSAIDALRDWTACRPGTSRVHDAPEALDFTHWAQDALTGARTPDGRDALVLSTRFSRRADAEAARLLARASGLPLFETPLPLDGGDIVASGDLLLVGADLHSRWGGGTPDESRRTVSVGGAAAGAGEEVVLSDTLPAGWRERLRTGSASGRRAPLFHLDLFVAPAGTTAEGRPRFLVGCPRLGAEAMGLPLLPHADAEIFDEAAAALEAAGAEAIRNPLPLFWIDHEREKIRSWLHLPANNALVEIADGRRRVWLPQFGEGVWPELARVDAANRAIWEGRGFAVTPVAGCLPLAERRGALRCMVNVVARDPA